MGIPVVGNCILLGSKFRTDFFFFFCFLGPHLWCMEVPRLGDELELQLLDYTTVTAMRIQAVSPNYTMAHGNAGSLTH